MDAAAATRVPAAHEQGAEHRTPRRSQRIRGGAVGVLVVLGVLASLLAPVAGWTRALVFDTDRYTSTLTPVARDPGVRQAVVRTVEREFATQVDIERFVRERLPARAGVLAAPLRAAVMSLIHDVVDRVVSSRGFVAVWDAVNRAAHATVVRALRGEPLVRGGVVALHNGSVVLDLAPVVRAVRTRLLRMGLFFAAAIPPTGAVIEIAHAPTLTRVADAARLLDTVGFWLPLAALALLTSAVATARRRRRTAMVAALGVAGAMVVLSLGLTIARHVVVTSVPAGVVDRATAGRLFDAIVAALHTSIVAVLVVALLAVGALWFAGDGARPVRQRLAVMWAARNATRHRGLRVVEVVVLAAAAVVLVFAGQPSAWTVGVVLAIALGTVVVVESALRAAPADEQR